MKKLKRSREKKGTNSGVNVQAKFPRHDLTKALRIPRAILEQNAGKECTDKESAVYSGVGFNGPYKVEISSAIKYGFLERPRSGLIKVTDLAKKALRPQGPGDEIEAFREAILKAPDISDVYKHYRGENLPDRKFFDNAIADKFGIPSIKADEFYRIFVSSLEQAHLIEKAGDKMRIADISQDQGKFSVNSIDQKTIKEKVETINGSCFVVMPFILPVGGYYQSIFEPAIEKAGLLSVRADADIFATGKIIDQVWRGINEAKVLVAVLTGRNPNVFYELGLAHALKKPVVLVSSNEDDVPFDLQHIRVIYYDVSDPFWGSKLIEKIAENILSAIQNPEEAVFQAVLENGGV